jgi:hypothetical protein
MAALAFPAGWSKPVTTAIVHMPLLIAVLVSVPALLIYPFLPKTWSTVASVRLHELRGWHRDILDRLNHT